MFEYHEFDMSELFGDDDTLPLDLLPPEIQSSANSTTSPNSVKTSMVSEAYQEGLSARLRSRSKHHPDRQPRSALCDQAMVENKNENESSSIKTGLFMNQIKKGSSTNELLVRAFIESANESKKVTTAIDQLSHLPAEVAALNEKIENLETFRRETMTILENYHLTQIHLSHLQNQLAMREQQIDFMYRSLANVNSKFRLMLQSLAQKDNRIFEGFQ
ncbi:hypothetical protein BO82DRAFT_396921, partial [Aspergillus uvarum CBS 121591]